jgi:hypothetical protein
MTPSQQFNYNTLYLVMSVIVTPLITLFIGVMVKRFGIKADAAAVKADAAAIAAGAAATKAGEVAVKAEEAVVAAGEAAKELTVVRGEVRELGRQVDGRLQELLKVSGAAEYLRGREEGRTSVQASLRAEVEQSPVPVTIVADTPVPVILAQEGQSRP